LPESFQARWPGGGVLLGAHFQKRQTAGSDGLEAESVAIDDPLKVNALGSQLDGAVQDNADHGFDEHLACRKLPHATAGSSSSSASAESRLKG
jgi:hypothetical protein